MGAGHQRAEGVGSDSPASHPHGSNGRRRPDAEAEAPQEFREIWGNSPGTAPDEHLELGDDGSFRVRRGSEMEELDGPAAVAEYILQTTLDKSLWPQFAAFMPSLYPPGTAGGGGTVAFPPGGWSALVACAHSRGKHSPAQEVMEAVASHVCSYLSDRQINEAPDLARLFGMEEEEA